MRPWHIGQIRPNANFGFGIRANAGQAPESSPRCHIEATGNLQNRHRILKSGDSWPLVLVRRRPSRALHPGMAVCTRAFGHDVLVGRFCASSNSRRRSARANSPCLWHSRISHSEPSVCATLALLVGRVLRRRTPRVPRGFAGPQLELWAVCGDPDTTSGTIWLGFTSASRVTAPCVFHRHSERRHAGGAISG